MFRLCVKLKPIGHLWNSPGAATNMSEIALSGIFSTRYQYMSAKRPETRQKRMAELLAKLARGERP